MVLFGLGGVVGLLVISCILLMWRFTPSTQARKAWKERSLSEINSLVNQPVELNRLAEAMKTRDAASDDRWLSDRLMLLNNGEWLAYRSICSKENPKIADLFLARGSDGNWYYSTYHFCKGMIVLQGDFPPESISNFVQEYFLQKFDGQSDDCLEKTWPRPREQ
jgi:hypothetical protein